MNIKYKLYMRYVQYVYKNVNISIENFPCMDVILAAVSYIPAR